MAAGLASADRQITPDLVRPGPAELGLSVPGEHNRLNARAAIGVLVAGRGSGKPRRPGRSPDSPGQAAAGNSRANAQAPGSMTITPTTRPRWGGFETIREFDPDRLIACLPAPPLLADEDLQPAVRCGSRPGGRNRRARRLPGPRGAGRSAGESAVWTCWGRQPTGPGANLRTGLRTSTRPSGSCVPGPGRGDHRHPGAGDITKLSDRLVES